MGRQAHFFRLALGRSAFELPENSHERAPQGTGSSVRVAGNDDVEELRRPEANTEHIGVHLHRRDGQLFDERGHPVNPRSREFSQSMRRAQNEILSIVGVCVRDIPKPQDAQTTPRFEFNVELIQRTSQENWYGLVLRLIGAAVQCSCLWWIDWFRQRLLIFEIPQSLQLAEVLAIQTRSITIRSFLAGTLSQFTPLLFNEASLLAREIIGQADKNIITRNNLSYKNRARLHRLAPIFEILFTLVIDIITFPLVLQYHLLNLQLVPYNAVIPPLASFNPFSKLSPIQLVRMPTSIELRFLMGWLLSIITSSFVLLTGSRYIEVLTMDFFADKFQAEIMVPFPPDRYSTLYNDVDNLYNRLERDIKVRKENLRSWSGNAISRILGLLGWSWVNYRPYIRNRDPGMTIEAGHNEHATQERATHNFMTSAEQQANSHSASLGSAARELDNTSAVAIQDPSGEESNSVSENIVEGIRQHGSTITPTYRRTTLSETPSASLVFLLNEHLTTLLLLPVKAAILKHTIQQLISLPLNKSINGSFFACTRPLPPFRGSLVNPFNSMGFTELGFYVERLALASGIKLAVDLGLWICEWAAVTWVGRKMFNWGHL